MVAISVVVGNSVVVAMASVVGDSVVSTGRLKYGPDPYSPSRSPFESFGGFGIA